MAKKKGQRERLTPVPKPRARQESAAVGRKGKGQEGVPPDGPDLSYICEDLRSKAVPISELAFFQDNPVAHTEKDLAKTKASLAELGQLEPLVVNVRPSPPVILNGNGRVQVALALGWTHIAVTKIDVDESRANAIALVLNATAREAGWDRDSVAKIIEDVNTGHNAILDSLISDLATDLKLVPPDEPELVQESEDNIAEPEAFGILVECKTQEEQGGLLARLASEGLTCRAVSVKDLK